jgi:hypothetical protein
VYIRDYGTTVQTAPDPNLDSFRAQHGVPPAALSCHTAIVDSYVIEGHVSVSAILRLLKDRPAASGLALPGMPADSPGMGGHQATWNAQPVALITLEGKLVPFNY